MATYYAGVGGNDGNAGTSWALRKLTIQAAVNVATTAGDTVYVGPGTYRETCTFGTSGTAGNVISLIGDYTGANTSGVKGVVRITGSNDDIAVTRANCIVASGKSYITIRGFLLEFCSGEVVSLAASCVGITIRHCFLGNGSDASSGRICIDSAGATQSALTVDSCFFRPPPVGAGVRLTHSATVDAAGHVIKNCIFSQATGDYGVIVVRVGGVTIANCAFISGGNGVYISQALTVGQTVAVNNCLFQNQSLAMRGTVAGEVAEDYNTIYACTTARTNVTAGANSVTRPPLFDTRWFFEIVNGGRLVTPFDLASYSTLVEYNSGTGAPSTDMRGASVVGTYREWGALEYSANYRAQGPVSIAPIGGIG